MFTSKGEKSPVINPPFTLIILAIKYYHGKDFKFAQNYYQLILFYTHLNAIYESSHVIYTYVYIFMPYTIKDAWCEQFSSNQIFRASDRQLKPFGNQKKECVGGLQGTSRIAVDHRSSSLRTRTVRTIILKNSKIFVN